MKSSKNMKKDLKKKKKKRKKLSKPLEQFKKTPKSNACYSKTCNKKNNKTIN